MRAAAFNIAAEIRCLEDAADVMKRSQEQSCNPYSVTVERALEIVFRREARLRRKRGELVLIRKESAA